MDVFFQCITISALLYGTYSQFDCDNYSFRQDPSQPHSFSCGDGLCISIDQYCDYQDDCLYTFADENMFCQSECSGVQCRSDGICIPPSFLMCSGEVECSDASDEIGCENCLADQFYCQEDRTCIEFFQLCDGVKDCYVHGADEAFCDRYCDIEVDSFFMSPQSPALFIHTGLVSNPTGFYACNWSVRGHVNSYIFIDVQSVFIPAFGKFRLLVGTGSDHTVADNVVFSTYGSVGARVFYVTEQSTEAFIHIWSSRLATSWIYHFLQPEIVMEFYQRDERDCPANTTLCPMISTRMVCITQEAVCDGHFHCPDYWDEEPTQCQDKHQDACGYGLIFLGAEKTEKLIVRHSVYPRDHARNQDCIWVVSVHTNSRLEIKVRGMFPDDSSKVTAGIASENNEVDLSTLFMTVTSQHLGSIPGYSSRPGASVWLALHLQTPSTLIDYHLVTITLRAFKETGGCGSEEFACDNGVTCLPQHQRCDGIPQCPSLADEKGCSGCDLNVLSCGEKCLEDVFVCDGIAQCDQFSDEYQCGRCDLPPSIDVTDGLDHVISYLPFSKQSMDCLFLITASDDHWISLHFLFLEQFVINYPALKITVGDGHDPSDQSTLLHAVTYNEFLPVTFREYVTARSSRMWITQKVEASLRELSVLTVGYRFGNQALNATVTEIPPYECGKGQYRCPTGICIQNASICDGYVDCEDYGDELGCNACMDNEIFCRSQSRCIHVDATCGEYENCQGDNIFVCAPCGRRTIELSHHVQPFTLTSPNYPLNYYDDLECIWQIVAPPGNHVFVTVQVLQLKDPLSFGWGDTFTNKTMQIGPKLIGSDNPLVALASRNELMWIVLTTNAWEASSGFSFHVESRKNVSCEEEQVTCGSPDLICLTRPLTRFLELYHCGLIDSCGERTIYLTKDTIHNLTSPHYPGNYENNMDCTWKILADDPNGFIEFNFLNFDTESKYDKVTITSPGLSLGDISTTKTDAIYTITGDELVMSGPTKLTSILTGGDVSYVMFTSDGSVTSRGFRMEIKIRDSIEYDICDERGFHCNGTTVCVSKNAICDGFVQCGYGTDENQCSFVNCPEFFKCSRSGQCLLWEQVCDGTEQCLLGDDEINCDKNRCPDECDCWYKEGDLYVVCQSGWEKETLDNMAATTDVLRLSGGNMSKLEPGNFKRFFRLHTLYLTNNGIEEMQPLSYEGLGTLSWLNISQNNFTVLEKDTFKELINLQGIVIQDVPVARINEAAFRGLDELKTIVLMRGRFAVDDPITVNPNAIQNLAKLQTLYVDDHRLCCEFTGLKTFDTERCYTTQQQSPLFNCGSLMQNTFLRVFMWILGLSALIGNIAVVTWRCRIALTQSLGDGTKYVHNFLVLNLAISDFLMGVYMITIAIADIYFGQNYYTAATSWRLGRECKFAGIVSVLSSEASVFFVTLISLDRFFCIVYPHGMIRLTRFTARIAVATIWVAGFILSGLPTILADADSDIYGLSDVCIGLPLITKPARYDLQVGSIGNVLGSQSFSIPVPTDHKPAWTYSIILFLGVNLVCFLIITFAYTVIFLKFRASHQRMKESRANMSGKEEMTMALRMAVIVGTDLLCWMPVILMGILSQTGAVTIQPYMYAWTVVFILPINSSLNPYLYTIFSIISDRRSKGKATSINVSCFSRCCRKTKTEKDCSSICTCDPQCQTSETHL